MSDYMAVPHPGSARDMGHQAAVHSGEAAVPANAPAETIGGLVVPVRNDNPEEVIPRTFQLSATNQFGQILPRDMQRRRVVLIGNGNDFWLCESRETASQVAGNATASTFGMAAYIPKGIAITLESRDMLYAACSTTASTTSVSVITERYATPLP